MFAEWTILASLSILARWLYSSATTLLPGQDNSGPSVPISGATWFVVSCGFSLSAVAFTEIPKPRVT
jgi:hypothetical protein